MKEIGKQTPKRVQLSEIHPDITPSRIQNNPYPNKITIYYMTMQLDWRYPV